MASAAVVSMMVATTGRTRIRTTALSMRARLTRVARGLGWRDSPKGSRRCPDAGGGGPSLSARAVDRPLGFTYNGFPERRPLIMVSRRTTLPLALAACLAVALPAGAAQAHSSGAPVAHSAGGDAAAPNPAIVGVPLARADK